MVCRFKGNFPLTLFRYNPLANEDLCSVAAAFNLAYEALATLNGWDTPVLFTSEKEILIPNIPGIFLPEKPSGVWEEELAQKRQGQKSMSIEVSYGNGKKKSLVFYSGSKFTAQERIKFLGTLFSTPIYKGTRSSGFGYRPHPFTGKTSFHPGVDIEVDRPGTVLSSVQQGPVLFLMLVSWNCMESILLLIMQAGIRQYMLIWTKYWL